MADTLAQALEVIAQVVHDDTANCLDRSHGRWQSYGFHLAAARQHLRHLEGERNHEPAAVRAGCTGPCCHSPAQGADSTRGKLTAGHRRE